MAQAQINKEYRTFVRGFITEANPLSFPDNASVDEANFVLNRDGSRQRRLGMDYEDNYNLDTITAAAVGDLKDAAISLNKWSHAGDGTYNFWVLQVGSKLFLGDVGSASVSDGYKPTLDIDLTPYSTNANFFKHQVSISSGKGYMFVVGKYINPFRVKYTPSSDTITKTDIKIEIRDFIGVEDGTAVGKDQVTLTTLHKYNLKNQGWRTADPVLGETKDDLGYYVTPGPLWPGGAYPANNKIPAAALTVNWEPDPGKLIRVPFGEVHAPRGRFVLDLFNRDRSAVSNIPGITVETESGRPQAVAFFSGRVWYAGIESAPSSGEFNISTSVFFSQVLETPDKAGRCYQEADPTSAILSDLVATDGGSIKIPEIGQIHRMINVRTSLLLFADNGVWAISGTGIDEGFSATGYQVRKLTSVGTFSPQSIVEAEGIILYPSYAGIYALSPNQVSGNLEATNITETTIQKGYLDVPTISKIYSVGHYDSINKKVSWLYNDRPAYDGVSYRFWYTKELIFDTVLKAFYKYEISEKNPDVGPWVSGYIPSSAVSTQYSVNNVVVGPDNVVAPNPTQVIVGSDPFPGRGSTLLKYITFLNDSSTSVRITFSHYKSASFKDWDTYSGGAGLGANYESYLVTGHEILNDTMRNKQIVYLMPHFKRTETGYNSDMTYKNPSGCYIRTMWDFCNYGTVDPNDGSLTGKWAVPFQAYRLKRLYIPSGPSDTFKYGYEVITTKNRIRGVGKAISMRIYSEAGKDMHLLGWAVKYEGATVV